MAFNDVCVCRYMPIHHSLIQHRVTEEKEREKNKTICFNAQLFISIYYNIIIISSRRTNRYSNMDKLCKRNGRWKQSKTRERIERKKNKMNGTKWRYLHLLVKESEIRMFFLRLRSLHEINE